MTKFIRLPVANRTSNPPTRFTNRYINLDKILEIVGVDKSQELTLIKMEGYLEGHNPVYVVDLPEEKVMEIVNMKSGKGVWY